MARPTNGTLTGGGFTQTAGTTKYTKTTGTATALCDIANGNVSTGVAGVIASGSTPIAFADLATQITALATAGAQMGVDANGVKACGANGLQYYGITV